MVRMLRVFDAVSSAVYLGSAGSAIVFTTVAILYDVGLRAVGVQPPLWTSAATEYAMLVMTMAIAPYLVRHHGHVTVELVAGLLSARARFRLRRGINLLAVALCLLMAGIALKLGVEAHARGDYDMRAIELPRWILFGLLATGFGGCGIEFLRKMLHPAGPPSDDERL